MPRKAALALLLLLASTAGRPVPRAAADEEPPPPLTETEREEALERAEALTRRVLELNGQGRFGEAIEPGREALALRERALGPEHPLVAAACLNLGSALRDLGRLEEARPLLERALAIDEKALGPEAAPVAVDLQALANAAMAEGDWSGALALLERALAIQEAALREDHPDVASTLNNLGIVLRNLGRHDLARSAYERALAIREQEGGPDDPSLAQTLGNLAMCLRAMGLYESALPIVERALGILEATVGAEHPDCAMAASMLAVLLQDLGRHEEARPLLEHALAVRERVLGPEHPETAKALNNLALLLRDLGQYEEARPLYERALSIWESAFGAEHPAVSVLLNNLALLLRDTGRSEEALPLYERALAIREKAFGDGHPGVARSLNNVANALRDLGRADEALPLMERALAIDERTVGPEHPYVAQSLQNLAGLLRGLGRVEEAVPLLERAVAMRESLYGPDHPFVAWSLHNLAAVLGDAGRPEAAEEAYRRCLAIVEASVRRQFGGLQPAERVALVRSIRRYLAGWLEVAPESAGAGYAEVLRFKGLVARATEAERRLARRGGSAVAPRVEELRAAERRLATLANAMPPGFRREERARWRQDYAAAAAQREALALALARDFAPLREGLERLGLGVEDVRARLGPGEVLVDFLRTGDRYLAWLVAREGAIRRFDLGQADVLEAAAVAYAERLADRDAAPYDEALLGAGRALRDLVLGPVEARLGDGVQTLVLCPDAGLAAVPFAALPGSEAGRFLLDDYVLVHVSMAQALVPSAEEAPPGRGALAVGDVDYARAETSPEVAVGGPAPALAALTRAPRGRSFVPLPATQAEVAFVEGLLGEGTATLTGARATEASFRASIRGRRWLHLATHGFVREDLMAGLVRRRDDRGWLGAEAEQQLAAGHDPMLLSGLALAGANPHDGGHGDDGILTALEASHLDLEGVETVVLSACETALGRAESGEGVLGLVRGFRMAGARRVVASLWEVDDEATRILMERLYGALLDEGEALSTAEALRRAALALRASAGEGGRSFAAPRFWAAFVVYGH